MVWHDFDEVERKALKYLEVNDFINKYARLMELNNEFEKLRDALENKVKSIAEYYLGQCNGIEREKKEEYAYWFDDDAWKVFQNAYSKAFLYTIDRIRNGNYDKEIFVDDEFMKIFSNKMLVAVDEVCPQVRFAYNENDYVNCVCTFVKKFIKTLIDMNYVFLKRLVYLDVELNGSLGLSQGLRLRINKEFENLVKSIVSVDWRKVAGGKPHLDRFIKQVVDDYSRAVPFIIKGECYRDYCATGHILVKFPLFDSDIKESVDVFSNLNDWSLLEFRMFIGSADEFKRFIEVFKRLVYYTYLTSRACWEYDDYNYYPVPCLERKSVRFSHGQLEDNVSGARNYVVYSNLMYLSVFLKQRLY